MPSKDSTSYQLILYFESVLCRCISSAGNPNASEGCRIIIEICKEALLEVSNITDITDNQEKKNESRKESSR